MLTVEEIHTFYGVSHILQGVSVEIRAGENVCLIGRNGAGKSTTLKSIIGLTPPKSGSIKFSGEVISGKRPHVIAQKGIGYVPEDRRIFPNISVKDSLCEISYFIHEKFELRTPELQTQDFKRVTSLFRERRCAWQ